MSRLNLCRNCNAVPARGKVGEAFDGTLCEQCDGALFMSFKRVYWELARFREDAPSVEDFLWSHGPLPANAPSLATMELCMQEWAMLYLPIPLASFTRYGTQWPLPVGSDSLRLWGEMNDVREQDLPTPIGGMPDDALVGLVIERETELGRVRLYGLVQPFGSLKSWSHFYDEPYLSLPPYRYPIPPPGQDVARRKAQELARWYRKHILGLRVEGRPHGSVSDGPPVEEHEAYRLACVALRREDRTPTHIARRMTRTLDRKITPQYVAYWTDRTRGFPGDSGARKRRRKSAE